MAIATVVLKTQFHSCKRSLLIRQSELEPACIPYANTFILLLCNIAIEFALAPFKMVECAKCANTHTYMNADIIHICDRGRVYVYVFSR